VEEDKVKCRDEEILMFGVYDAFQADQNDDGGVGGRRIGFHAQTRTALWIIAELQGPK
jgi:hypothetical protein